MEVLCDRASSDEAPPGRERDRLGLRELRRFLGGDLFLGGVGDRTLLRGDLPLFTLLWPRAPPFTIIPFVIFPLLLELFLSRVSESEDECDVQEDEDVFLRDNCFLGGVGDRSLLCEDFKSQLNRAPGLG